MIDACRRVALLCLLAGFSLSVMAAETHDRLLLRLEAGVEAAAFVQQLDIRFEAAFTLQRRLGHTLILGFSPSLPRRDAETLAAQLTALPEVVYAELSGPRLRPQFVPNDPSYSLQWYLFESFGIDAQSAWDRSRGSPDVVIGLIDTGILTHRDLDPARILPGYDFVSNLVSANDGDGIDPDPTDPGDAVAEDECPGGNPASPESSWHGLLMAGLLIATADNGTDIAGVNHASRLLPVRAFGKCGGDFLDILTAMSWAAGMDVGGGVPVNPDPADVINLSFSGTGPCNQGVQGVIDQIRARGVVLVAAAGNEGAADLDDVVPANCDGVIAVAASNRLGDRAAFSNVGARIDIAAPGGDNQGLILTTHNDGDITAGNDSLAPASGTSLSSAQVSAGVSLMLSLAPGLSPDTVTRILRDSAQPFPAGSTCTTSTCGAGILDLDAALQQVSQSGSVVVNDGGGGGGCTLTAGSRIDAGLPLLLLLLFGFRSVRAWFTESRMD